ncbi:MAG: hypothetical protein M2R45_00124 [Verrucomicrobia subdivision 3 bacterium]|nr:hypothetical protein [Limisphaerales bacterium]MCS1412416.1 hypothetical protein [Limisphaerales bacterium]
MINAANAHHTIIFNRIGQGGIRLPKQENQTDDNMIADLTPFNKLLESTEVSELNAIETAPLLIDVMLSGGNLKGTPRLTLTSFKVCLSLGTCCSLRD